MKAAVLEQVGQPLVTREMPMPEIGRGDALIRMEACGVCHSDIHLVDGFFQAMGIDVFPIVPGHEVVGVVEEVGKDVKHVVPGDRVGSYFFHTCGLCGHCLGGHETACATLFTGPRLSGFSVDGGYAEYLATPADFLIPLPEALPFLEAAPLFCGGVTAYGALKRAELRAGQRVAILGVGGIGHMAIPIARAMGAEVVAITSAPKAQVAREMGADQILVRNGDVGAQLRELGGADVVLSSTLDPDDIASIFQGLRVRGALVLTGMTAEPLCIMPAAFAFGQQRVIGSLIGTRQDQIELLAMAARHGIHPIVEQFPLARANEAHERLRAQQVRMRAVLTPN